MMAQLLPFRATFAERQLASTLRLDFGPPFQDDVDWCDFDAALADALGAGQMTQLRGETP